MTLFEEIIQRGIVKYGEHPSAFTDKQADTGHSYADPYTRLLTKKDNVRLLEIGISSGGSLWLWRQFFNSYNITAFDIAPTWFVKQEFQQEIENDTNITLKWNVNSTTATPYKNLEQFDYIIDDGDHRPESQAKTFINAWKYLKPGGVYFIEDIQNDNCIPQLANVITKHCRDAVIELYYGQKRQFGRVDDLMIIVKKRDDNENSNP
jgi:SAM-dependent methyltransferase